MAHAATRASQARTLDAATNRGQHWTQAEIDTVIARDEVATDEQIALALGRTTYAVWAIKETAVERRARIAATRGNPELPYDRGYADVEALFA